MKERHPGKGWFDFRCPCRHFCMKCGRCIYGPQCSEESYFVRTQDCLDNECEECALRHEQEAQPSKTH